MPFQEKYTCILPNMGMGK